MSILDIKLCSCDVVDGFEKVVVCGMLCVVGMGDEDFVKF